MVHLRIGDTWGPHHVLWHSAVLSALQQLRWFKHVQAICLVTSSSIIHYAHLMSFIGLISFQFSDSFINSFCLCHAIHTSIHSVLNWFTHSLIQSLNDFLIHSPMHPLVHPFICRSEMHLFQSISFHPIKSCHTIHLISTRSFIHSHMPAINHSLLAPFPPFLPCFLQASYIDLLLCDSCVALQLHAIHHRATELDEMRHHRQGQYTLTPEKKWWLTCHKMKLCPGKIGKFGRSDKWRRHSHKLHFEEGLTTANPTCMS